MSDVSSLDGDGMNVDLLNPETRKFINDKEYLKFVSIQMWWNFLSVFFLGMYGCMLAIMGSIQTSTSYLQI